MPTISTDPVSSLASALPARAVVAIVLVAGIVAILCYMSPLCLTRAFVTTIGDAVKTYIEAQGAGLLSEVEVQMLHVLRLNASITIEDTLRSPSPGRGAPPSAIFCAGTPGPSFAAFAKYSGSRRTSRHVYLASLALVERAWWNPSCFLAASVME
ncbi:hypothetical protein B0H13DRAFT_2273339 [Mycena leptocephala]|nr:hypothetical protein B0H13DRAFT_2273339 [Mycena leptocephala]